MLTERVRFMLIERGGRHLLSAQRIHRYPLPSIDQRVGSDPGGRSFQPAHSVRSVEQAPKRCPQFGLGVILRGATKNGRTVGGHAQHGP